MTKTNHEKIYSIITGICFALCFALYVINIIIRRMEYMSYGISLRYDWADIIYGVVLLACSIVMFLPQKRIAAIVIFAMFVLYRGYDSAASARYYGIWFFLPWAAVLLLLFLMLALKNSKIVRNIWFFAIAVLGVSTLMFWIRWIDLEDLKYCWRYILLDLIEVIGLLFFGLWSKADIIAGEASATSDTYGAFSAQNVSESYDIGGADRLKTCKELLDAGVITQEEFDAKKKQILGLND